MHQLQRLQQQAGNRAVAGLLKVQRGFDPNAPAFVPGGAVRAVPVLPAIGEAGFQELHTAGRVVLQPVKWWRSANFPHHNIEMRVLADGRPWAVVHIKWKDRSGPTSANVQMMTFKGADGASIYGGNIWGGATYQTLLDAALQHAASAPPTQTGDVLIAA